jgi:crossover junction endodeoxyribonuclease RusA
MSAQPITMPLRSVELVLPYPSSTGNHSVRHTKTGGHYVTAEAKEYRAQVAMALRGCMAPRGPISTAWTFYPPDLRARDSTNLLKVVEDALTRALFWEDDSNKVIVCGSWGWGPVVKGGVIELVVSSQLAGS